MALFSYIDTVRIISGEGIVAILKISLHCSGRQSLQRSNRVGAGMTFKQSSRLSHFDDGTDSKGCEITPRDEQNAGGKAMCIAWPVDGSSKPTTVVYYSACSHHRKHACIPIDIEH
jgi:hypothetical protein